MKKIIIAIAITLISVSAILLINTLRFSSQQTGFPEQPRETIEEKGAVARLATAIRFQTISIYDNPGANAEEFTGLRQHIAISFPLLNSRLEKVDLGEFTSLYCLQGRSSTRKPVLLLAHLDVVGVDSATEGMWLHPPFSGDNDGNYIWGRGTWDDKSSAFAIMEAVEHLLESNFQPDRTIYIALGPDEEIGGTKGARPTFEFLKSHGVHLEYVLDEGQVLTEGILPGIKKPVALIGIAEKGYMSATLRVQLPAGGHSSMPPAESAIGILGAGISRLEKEQFPNRLQGIPLSMLEYLAPEAEMPFRAIMSNLWLFGPFVEASLSKARSTEALLHTTTAATEFSSGFKDNVLPSRATASVNFRIQQGETSNSVLDRITRILDDSRIELEKPAIVFEPSRVSEINSEGFRTVQRSIHEVFGDVVTAPALVTAHTDSVWFEPIADNVYRFLPMRAERDDIPRFHGINERISISNYVNAIQFYLRFLRNVD